MYLVSNGPPKPTPYCFLLGLGGMYLVSNGPPKPTP